MAAARANYALKSIADKALRDKIDRYSVSNPATAHCFTHIIYSSGCNGRLILLHLKAV